MDKKRKPKLNIPNTITILRLFIALGGFLLMFLGYWTHAFITLTVAVLLDIADGIIARKLNQTTKHGIYLDIMVDKIVIISTFLIIGFTISRPFFFLGILMLVREYMIDTLRSIAASSKIVLSSDKFSKIKGVLFMTAMLLAIGNHAFNANIYSENIINHIAIWIAAAAMIMAYITLARFILLHKDLLKQK